MVSHLADLNILLTRFFKRWRSYQLQFLSLSKFRRRPGSRGFQSWPTKTRQDRNQEQEFPVATTQPPESTFRPPLEPKIARLLRFFKMVKFKQHRSVFFLRPRKWWQRTQECIVPTRLVQSGGAGSQHMLGFSYSQDPLQESADMVKGMVAHCTQVVAETRYLLKLNVYQSFQENNRLFSLKTHGKNLVLPRNTQRDGQTRSIQAQSTLAWSWFFLGIESPLVTGHTFLAQVWRNVWWQVPERQ